MGRRSKSLQSRLNALAKAKKALEKQKEKRKELEIISSEPAHEVITDEDDEEDEEPLDEDSVREINRDDCSPDEVKSIEHALKCNMMSANSFFCRRY